MSEGLDKLFVLEYNENNEFLLILKEGEKDRCLSRGIFSMKWHIV